MALDRPSNTSLGVDVDAVIWSGLLVMMLMLILSSWLLIILRLSDDGACGCVCFCVSCGGADAGGWTGGGLNMGTRKEPRARRNSVRVDKRTLTLGPAPVLALEIGLVLALVPSPAIIPALALGLAPAPALGLASTPYRATSVALFCRAWASSPLAAGSQSLHPGKVVK